MWHEHLHGRAHTELTQIQVVALAGEFYRETVAAHRDNPGRPVDWQLSLEHHEKKKKSPIRLLPLGTHCRFVFGDEAAAFLKKRGLHLVGETFEKLVRAYIAAKEQAERQLMKNAGDDYSPDPEVARFPSADVLKNGRKQTERQDRAERLSRVGEGDLAICRSAGRASGERGQGHHRTHQEAEEAAREGLYAGRGPSHSEGDLCFTAGKDVSRDGGGPALVDIKWEPPTPPRRLDGASDPDDRDLRFRRLARSTWRRPASLRFSTRKSRKALCRGESKVRAIHRS
jgi:hypothetical protein